MNEKKSFWLKKSFLLGATLCPLIAFMTTVLSQIGMYSGVFGWWGQNMTGDIVVSINGVVGILFIVFGIICLILSTVLPKKLRGKTKVKIKLF